MARVQVHRIKSGKTVHNVYCRAAMAGRRRRFIGDVVLFCCKKEENLNEQRSKMQRSIRRVKGVNGYRTHTIATRWRVLKGAKTLPILTKL